MSHRAGKQTRYPKPSKYKQPEPKTDSVSFAEIMNIMAPQNLEVLDDALIAELSKSMTVERLQELRDMGMKYNRERESFSTGEVGFF